MSVAEGPQALTYIVVPNVERRPMKGGAGDDLGSVRKSDHLQRP
jgi:hypothetical protein